MLFKVGIKNSPKRSSRLVSILGVALLSVVPSASLLAAELPIGIPAPSFGFAESHQMYANDASYSMSASGPYTHYVDNSISSCSDLFNDGTTENPRCSIPSDLDAGDVVEVHGGPYERFDLKMTFSGTRDAPIFLRGVDDGNGNPILDGSSDPRNSILYLDGTYAVFENFRLSQTGIRLGADVGGDHLAIRNLDIGWHPKTCVTIAANHSLVIGSEIHHCQDSAKDRHGVYVTSGTDYTWILNNHIHHNSGNGIQYTHQAELDPPDYVFIGGNHIHSDREVAIATKWAGKTVVSSNVIHSYRPSTTGETWCFDDNSSCMTPAGATNGPGIILGADGYPLEKWIIYNIIYDSNHCIRNEKSIKARIIGNVCANIQGVGIGLEKLSEDMYIVNNTFYNIGLNGQSGVIQQDWREFFDLNVQNNLFLLTAGRALWFEQAPVMNKMEFNNNLLWNGGADFPILWKNDVVSVGTIGELQSLIRSDLPEMMNNIVADPLIDVRNTPSPVIADFSPPENSPLVGAGSNVLLTLDAEFKASFGASVTIIPDEWRDNQFDIGAVPAGLGEEVVAPLPPVLE